jgi:Uncharacterized conserved protein
MHEAQPTITEAEKTLLLQLARASIGSAWYPELQEKLASTQTQLTRLAQPQACFVTLNLDGRLRGCIGTLEAVMNFPAAICHYAKSAAFGDPRFYPLDVSEWPAVIISITLLGPLQPISAESRETVLSRLTAEKAGLYLKDAHHSATFLPMVWQQLPEPTQFLDALLEKGHWSHAIWPEHLNAWIYSGEEFSE